MFTVAYNDLKGLEKLLRDMPKEAVSPDKMNNVLLRAAVPIRKAVRELTPIAGKTIIRRTRSGKVAATYLPGNLKRSVKIFSAKNAEKPAVFVGFAAGEKRTNDGWYGAIVEGDTVNRETKRKGANRGRRKGNKMVSKGFENSKNQSESIIMNLTMKEIENYWNNTKIN